MNLVDQPHPVKPLGVNEYTACNNDIKIIDLETRGEEGSISSTGRSTSDFSNQVSPAVYDGMPPTSASYSDRERETSSPHSEDSSASSHKGSSTRYVSLNGKTLLYHYPPFL